MDENVIGYYNAQAENCEYVCNVNDWNLELQTPTVKGIVSKLHPETMKRYYGTGFVIPECVEGLRILDIGCGSGSLVFILSKLVGPTGSVVGVDFSDVLIRECKAREEFHREAWGFDKTNTEFFEGNVENMAVLGLKDNTFDVIVSNGVICLTSDKEKVFSEAFRLLKDGGEMSISDVYCNKHPPAEMHGEPKAWVHGLTGTQTLDEFKSCTAKAGFTAPILTGAGPVKLSDTYEYSSKLTLTGSRYCCGWNRIFRVPSSGRRGPAKVTYKGNIAELEEAFRWDVSLTFQAGQAVTVDGDLASILANSRFKDVFDIVDTTDTATTQWAQSPFDYLDKLAEEGTILKEMYALE